jgi:hypothetical protein
MGAYAIMMRAAIASVAMHGWPEAVASDPYRSLVCITTCRRLPYLRRYLPHFARFCDDDSRFSLLVSLDGDEADTRHFCEKWEVPLLHSDKREGVGISKNRVLERFPDFDYYFFLEDDVELVDGRVLPAHVEISKVSRIHHFTLFQRGGIRKVTARSTAAGRRVLHGLYGGADFSFYTGTGLRHVGGWHPRFAEYRRWGHTEHSYRFVRAELAPAPFNVAEDLADACIWHTPPAVTRVDGVTIDADQIAAPERELMERELSHVPVETISDHHLNGVPLGRPSRLARVLAAGERYPLADDKERRRCRSDYNLWRFMSAATLPERATALVAATWNWPANPALRHRLKMALRR